VAEDLERLVRLDVELELVGGLRVDDEDAEVVRRPAPEQRDLDAVSVAVVEFFEAAGRLGGGRRRHRGPPSESSSVCVPTYEPVDAASFTRATPRMSSARQFSRKERPTRRRICAA
jgi:hypothetical protein